MKKSNSTKHSLLISIISLVISCAMLIGSTFAWFTDSATSGRNKIVAGVLDVELYTTDAEGDYTVPVGDETKLFDEDALWEPGYVQTAYLKIANVGDLALKYNFTINVEDEVIGKNEENGDIKLSDILKFGYVVSETKPEPFADRSTAIAAVKESAGSLFDLGQSGRLAPAGTSAEFTDDHPETVGDSAYVTLVVYMPQETGNEANYRGDIVPSIDMGITLTATQTPYESDSFDNQYDADATYPVIEKQAKDDGSLTFTFPGETPTKEGATVVKFPARSFEPGDKVALTINTAAVGDEDTGSYPEVSGRVPVAIVDLSLTVNGKPATTFNDQTVDITTVIRDQLEDVKVIYADDAAQDYLKTYDSETGNLTFSTNHFSEYIVYAKEASQSNSLIVEHLSEANDGFTNNIVTTLGVTKSKITKVVFSSWDKYQEELAGTYSDFSEGIELNAKKKAADSWSTDLVRGFVKETDVYVLTANSEAFIKAPENMDHFLNIGFNVKTMDITALDTSSATNMKYLFSSNSALTEVKLGDKFITDNVTDMNNMFASCSVLNNIDLTKFNTSNVKNFSYMFSGARGFTNLDLTTFDTSNAEDLNHMFIWCYNIQSIDLSSFNVQKVTDMSSMFTQCYKLTDITFWTTPKSEGTLNVDAMFRECKALQSIDLTPMVTSDVTIEGNMSYFFYNCLELQSVNFGNMNTSEVTALNELFNSCSKLTDINFGTAFNTGKVENMDNLFCKCSSLRMVDISSFDNKVISRINNMFLGCTNLETVYTKPDFDLTDVNIMHQYMTRYDSSSNSYITKLTGKYVSGSTIKTNGTPDGHSDCRHACVATDNQKGYFTDVKWKSKIEN